MHIQIYKNYLTYREYRVKCATGKRGIGEKKREGDLITPLGSYKIKFIMYRRDRFKKIKTRLKKIVIKKNMGWCNDPRSKKYNQLINLPFDYGYEKLHKKENIYDIILVLDYNMNPTKKNKGSAIFIHISRKNYSKTEGCIAIRKPHLLKIIKEIKSATKVKILNQK